VLTVGFTNGVFALYELPDFNNIHSLSISQKRITSLAVNPSGEWLAFASAKLGQLLVWEWQSESYVLKQQGHFYDMNVVAFSPNGQYMATGGDDGKVKLWSTNSGFCVVTFKEHTGKKDKLWA
jgi:periodic tryptophan protein 2